MKKFVEAASLVAFFAGLGLLLAHWSACEKDQTFCALSYMEIHK